MGGTPFDALIQRAARAICAKTNIARPGEPEVIFDNPDDLMWDSSETPPRPMPRWLLYEDRARAVLETIYVAELSQALHSILLQVKEVRRMSQLSSNDPFMKLRSLLNALLDTWNEGEITATPRSPARLCCRAVAVR